MEQLKCLTCGGNLILSEDKLHAKCEVCGNIYEYKAPKDDYWVQQLNEANDLRLHMDFDGAIGKYRIITKNNSHDADAHWGLLLSKYGVAYEQDLLGEYIPTFHRNRRSNIAEDPSAINAINFASDNQKEVYQKDLAELRRIQEGIEENAKKCDPYDVFISFKATDAEGKTTIDRDVAFNIYDELNSKNIKTFFSEVTLRDMASSDYEAVIFNALNTCKVFILVGTSKENINATWVKNEWTRYRERIVEDQKNGTLISSHFAVVGGDLEPADLPNLFQRTQNVMLSKYAGQGYRNDIGLSVMKILGIEPEMKVSNSEKKEIARNYAMAEKLIASGEYDKARGYYVKATEIDPNNDESWWRLYALDNRIDLSKPMVFETTCTSIEDFNKKETANKKQHDIVENPDFLAFRERLDAKLVKKIDKYIEESNAEFVEKSHMLNQSLLEVGLDRSANAQFDKAISTMNRYLESETTAPDYRAYLVLAYAPQKRKIDDTIIISSAGTSLAHNKAALADNKFIKDIFNSENYLKAIELAEGKEKKRIATQRDDILAAYDEKFKEIENTLVKSAMKAFKEQEYDRASKLFNDLITQVDATNPEYLRYKYLSDVKMQSFEAIKASVKTSNAYKDFVNCKSFEAMINLGGELGQQAETLRDELIAKNTAIIDTNFADLKLRSYKAYEKKHNKDALDGFDRLLKEDPNNLDYAEKYVFSYYGVTSRDELFTVCSSMKSYAETLAKDKVVNSIIKNPNTPEDVKQAYINGIATCKSEAQINLDEWTDKKDVLTRKNAKNLTKERNKISPILERILLFPASILMWLVVFVPAIVPDIKDIIPQPLGDLLVYLLFGAALIIFLVQLFINMHGRSIRKQLALVDYSIFRANSKSQLAVYDQRKLHNSSRRKDCSELMKKSVCELDSNKSIARPELAITHTKFFILLFFLAVLGLLPIYYIIKIVKMFRDR